VDLQDIKSALDYYEAAQEFFNNASEEWGIINTSVAKHRALLIFGRESSFDELRDLKERSLYMNYNVLADRIDNLISGNRDPIRFESG
jgi:hypothetical protein